MNNRDDFPERVRRPVAARAGWHCSMCGKPTEGPSEDSPGAVASIGKAAHICAAAPGGPRYDPSMTPEERAGFDNAIWLCSDHATLIDRDKATYTVDSLRKMKREHEKARGREMRTGSRASLAIGLLAVGPDVICTGDLVDIRADSWTLSLRHFLISDMHGIISFIDGFAREATDDKYVLSNELGDGRILMAAPSLTKQADGYSLVCPVAPAASRVDAQNIGSGMATHAETNDLYVDAKGDIARVAGLEYLPQRVREVLSMQRGESPFAPNYGMRFFEYFEAYRGTPWLDLLFKLDVVRQASIAFRDGVMGRTQTPLQRVTRVRNVELLAETPTANRLPVRVEFDVQGVGPWTRELSIYLPTAEQMAKRAKMLAGMPWLADSARRKPA
jgi:hypothetical protein